MRGKTVRTDRARQRFLATLEETCNVSESARKAGFGRATAYAWRDDDHEFAKLWDEAEQVAVDKLEKVAWERATAGNSDRMLELLLKAHRPEKFKDRIASELTGKDGGPIETKSAVVEITADMTAEQAAEAYHKLLG